MVKLMKMELYMKLMVICFGLIITDINALTSGLHSHGRYGVELNGKYNVLSDFAYVYESVITPLALNIIV